MNKKIKDGGKDRKEINKMANYNSKKNRTGRIVAGVLIGVLAVAAAAGAGMSLYMGIKNNGWFEKETEIEDTDDTTTDDTTATAYKSGSYEFSSLIGA